MARKFFPIVVLALAFAVFYTPDTFEPDSIRGKRVFITGASSGIGEELAYAYSRLGAIVLLTARRENLLKDVTQKCRDLGAERVEYVVADMAVAKDREELMVQVEKLAQNQLDQLILNHAIFKPGHFLGTPQNMSTLQRDLQVNFVSFVDIASRSQKMLLASKDGPGRIGVVSSAAAKFAVPLLASYSAEKFALHGFFSSWRQELKARQTPISITLCVLGYIETDAAVTTMTTSYSNSLSMLPTPASPADTAVAIMKGVNRGVYEFIYPRAFVTFVLAIHRFFPGYVEDYLGSQL